MIFTSSIFLFLFLPLALLFYFVARPHWRNALLLAASILFYAFGEGYYICIIIVSIVINYFLARWIDHYNARETVDSARRKKAITIFAIIINLGVLIVVKYTHFIVSMIPFHSVAVDEFHLPIGISFFTFKAVSYIVDVYRKKINADKNIIDVGLYISLFPQLLAGPISRYPDLAGQIKERTINSEMFAGGIRRFVIGMAKKVLIADALAPVVDDIFRLSPGSMTVSTAWLGLIGYTIQLYFDFSGYTDMALGLGRMFGFTFMENFNYPYLSQSIREFWGRWHISLSTWFRDYLYIPLGGNKAGRMRTYINLVTVFFLCGLWHGASWCFVVWGLWHGIFILLERIRWGKMLDSLWRPLRHAYAMIVVMLGFVFFRSESLTYAVQYLQTLFGLSSGSGLYYPGMFLDNYIVIAYALGIICSTSIFPEMRNRINRILDKRQSGITRQVAFIGYNIMIFLLLFLSAMQVVSTTYHPFLYFKF
jgi:alginate O-acetyltransferase complex protein AlgI